MTFENLTCILGPLKTLVCCGRFYADLVAIARYHTNVGEGFYFENLERYHSKAV